MDIIFLILDNMLVKYYVCLSRDSKLSRNAFISLFQNTNK